MTKATLYLEPELHKALKVKAAQTGRTVSDVANKALAEALADDQGDIATLKERDGAPTEPYEDFLNALKADGKL
jgi:plasmid stability protein